MGFTRAALTQSGVLTFISGNFAAATFAVASDAGDNDARTHAAFRLLHPPRIILPPLSDSNSTVIDGQFVVLGSVLLKFDRVAGDCQTLDNFVALCGPERVAASDISWRQIRCGACTKTVFFFRLRNGFFPLLLFG